ncbi:MAG: hypothetical protein IPK27_00210 [Rhodanobacteraceae bacterium]|nr:hypothetical protein [Rhodanobacteraceae bacterium]
MCTDCRPSSASSRPRPSPRRRGCRRMWRCGGCWRATAKGQGQGHGPGTCWSRATHLPAARGGAPCPCPPRCALPRAPLLPHSHLRLLDPHPRIDLNAGQVCAGRRVDPGEWYFKAHFFQDPVQPGSLGLEAMLQALQAYLLDWNAHSDIAQPRFQGIATGLTHRWKYRGQVLPHHRQVHTTLEITDRGRDEQGVYAIARGSLWVDGQRIYEAQGIGMRIVPGAA